MKEMLGRVMAVVERLALAEKGRGVNELARELRLAPSNVHRILRALMALDYVRQEMPLRTYSLTPRLFSLGMAAGERIDVRELARRELEQLAAATREDIGLTILDQHDIIYIDHIQGAHMVRTQQLLGERAPAFCTAAGRSILAFRSDGEKLIRTSTRRAFTERTVTDVKSLIAQLSRVRRLGYAVVVEERHKRVSSVAAPILDSSGNAIAALSVFGLSERMRPRLRDYAELLLAAVETVSQRLRGGLQPRAVAGKRARRSDI